MGATAPDVGVDVGGTTLTAALVDRRGVVLRDVVIPTPRPEGGARVLEDRIVEAVDRVSGGTVPPRVGVAAAAFISRDRERATYAPHLAWRGEPVARTLSERIGAPVLLENDATCAAWGEATLGAAALADSSITLTVGTGIGGGIVVGGDLLRGSQGMAGEFGHVRVVPDGRRCPCGARGCWERYVSAGALVEASRRHGGDHSWTAQQVGVAAEAGDSAALAAFAEVGAWLGTGLLAAVAVIDPSVIVVGGGVGGAGELLLAPARRVLARDLVGAPHREAPRVVSAALGNAAGLLGAVMLARDAFLGSG